VRKFEREGERENEGKREDERERENEQEENKLELFVQQLVPSPHVRLGRLSS